MSEKDLRDEIWDKLNIHRLLKNDYTVRDKFVPEGYWATVEESEGKPYPWPKANELNNEDAEEFIHKLYFIENKIKTNNLSNSCYFNFLGKSTCRCCKKDNGTGEYMYKGWKWPEGFMHYLEEHKVKPTPRFVFFINETYENIHSKKNKNKP